MTGGQWFSRTAMEVEEYVVLGVSLETSGLPLRYDVPQPQSWPAFFAKESPTAQAFSPARVRYGSSGLGNSYSYALYSQSEVRLPHFFDYLVALGGKKNKTLFLAALLCLPLGPSQQEPLIKTLSHSLALSHLF
jgi:hypothetical protein